MGPWSAVPNPGRQIWDHSQESPGWHYHGRLDLLIDWRCGWKAWANGSERLVQLEGPPVRLQLPQDAIRARKVIYLQSELAGPGFLSVPPPRRSRRTGSDCPDWFLSRPCGFPESRSSDSEGQRKAKPWTLLSLRMMEYWNLPMASIGQFDEEYGPAHLWEVVIESESHSPGSQLLKH